MTRRATNCRLDGRKVGEFMGVALSVGVLLAFLSSYLILQLLSPWRTTSGTHVTRNGSHHIILNTINQDDYSVPLMPISETTEPPFNPATEMLVDDIGSMPFWMMHGGPLPPNLCGYAQLSPHEITGQPQPLDQHKSLHERLGDKLETFREPGIVVSRLFRIVLDPGMFPSPPSSTTVSGTLTKDDYEKAKAPYLNMMQVYIKTKRDIMTAHTTAVCEVLKRDGAQGVVMNSEADMLRTMSYVGAFDEDTLVAVSRLPRVAKIAYVRSDGKRQ